MSSAGLSSSWLSRWSSEATLGVARALGERGASCAAADLPRAVAVAFRVIPRTEHFFDDFPGLAKEIRDGWRLRRSIAKTSHARANSRVLALFGTT